MHTRRRRGPIKCLIMCYFYCGLASRAVSPCFITCGSILSFYSWGETRILSLSLQVSHAPSLDFTATDSAGNLVVATVWSLRDFSEADVVPRTSTRGQGSGHEGCRCRASPKKRCGELLLIVPAICILLRKPYSSDIPLINSLIRLYNHTQTLTDTQTLRKGHNCVRPTDRFQRSCIPSPPNTLKPTEKLF